MSENLTNPSADQMLVQPGLQPTAPETELTPGELYAVWYGDDKFGKSVELDIPGLPGSYGIIEGDASFNASFEEDFHGNKTLKAGSLSVAEGLQGQGYGERLTRALGKVAEEQGCMRIEASLNHPAALKHLIKVFGADRTYVVVKDRRGSVTRSPVVQDEVMAEINAQREAAMRFNGKEWVPYYRDMDGVDIEVDLEGLDTSGWESPTPLQVSEYDDYDKLVDKQFRVNFPHNRQPPDHDYYEAFGSDLVSWDIKGGVRGHEATQGFIQPGFETVIPVSDGGENIMLTHHIDGGSLRIEELDPDGKVLVAHSLERDGDKVSVPEGREMRISTLAKDMGGQIVEYVCEYPSKTA